MSGDIFLQSGSDLKKRKWCLCAVFFKSVYKVYKLKHFLFSWLHLPLLNPKTCNLNKSWLKYIFWHMSWSSNNMNEASARIYMGNLNYGDPYNLCLPTISSESVFCEEADLRMEVSIKQREYDVVEISKQTRKLFFRKIKQTIENVINCTSDIDNSERCRKSVCQQKQLYLIWG